MGVLHKGNKKPPGGSSNRRGPLRRCNCTKEELEDESTVELMWNEIDRQIDEVSEGFAEMRYHIAVAEGRLDELGGQLMSGITDQINTMEMRLNLIRSTLNQLRQAQCSDIAEL